MAGDFDDKEATGILELPVEILAQLRAKPSSLEMVSGPGAPRTVPLDKDKLVFGRSSQTDVQIDSLDLSRRHFALSKSENEWLCEDLDSRNGVFLNGLRIHSAVLRDGDHIQLGRVVFVFHKGR
ncbi:MAG: FHA domain-containing protein [Myxococcales bacterium]|jgi:pSer/pThr/pTyr-binding forkhead associated (FHA) protein